MNDDEQTADGGAQTDDYPVEVLKQYEAIRRSGKTNMLDVNTVQVIAFESDFHHLVVFIEDHDADEYIHMGASAARRFVTRDLGDGYDVPDTITREVEL